ncbi:hypothetical protein CR513_11154, partial [Mucuna pruriens]
MEKEGEQYTKIANKGKNGKLLPRGDGPFIVLHRVNDNAYILDKPQEYGGSTTFNIAYLSSFISSMDNPNLRANFFQDGKPNVNLERQGKQEKGIKHKEA